MKSNFEALTFTTFGYKHYTNNLLKSIEVNRVDLDVKVYALDAKSVKYFNKFHSNVEQFTSDNTLPSYMKQKGDKFVELMFKNFNLFINPC